MSEISDVVIYRAERLRSSANGNPSYRFHTSKGAFLMTTDASLGYAVDNYVWSQWRDREGSLTPSETLVIGNPAEPRVTLVLDRGRVSYIKRDGRVLS
jgi:hypothetical protein